MKSNLHPHSSMWYYLRYPIRCFWLPFFLLTLRGLFVCDACFALDAFHWIRSVLTRTTHFPHHLFIERTLLTTWHYAKLVPTFRFFLLIVDIAHLMRNIYLYSMFAWFGKANKHTLTNANSTCNSSIFFFTNWVLCLFYACGRIHKRYSLIWSWLVSMLFFFSIRKFA